jgi:hypothetical protein
VRSKDYGRDVLAGERRRRPALAEVAAERDLVVEDAETGFCGAVVVVEKQPEGVLVVLEDRHGRRRSFPLGPGFLVDGAPVRLVRPVVAVRPHRPGRRRARSPSPTCAPASRAAAGSTSRGRHDAELVERGVG